MKTNTFLVLAASLLFAACSKDKTTDNPPTTTDPFINTTAGSTWSYHTVDNSTDNPKTYDYTLTSTSNDTSINSKKYHVYSRTDGQNEYLNISGHDYYKYESIPGTTTIGEGITAERLYLRDNINTGATWKQDFTIQPSGSPIPLTFTLNNTIKEKGISRTVNGTAYTDVIHVSSTLTSGLITSGLTSAIDMYYAPKYGLIESNVVVSLNYMGFVQNVNINTQLKTAVLK